MARYLNEAQAAADGIRIVHQPDEQRYALMKHDDGKERLVGEAHYTLVGAGTINFDHTFLQPELRGSGLSGLLAEHAVTGSAAAGRKIIASCWFIAGYIERHPELVKSQGV